MKKTKVRIAMNVYTIYNFVNILLGIADTFMRPRVYQMNGFFAFIGGVMTYLIAAYSYLIIPAIIFSLVAVIYYLKAGRKWEDRSTASVMIAITVMNVMGISYFVLLYLAQ